MGRARLGAAARDKVGSVRVTDHQYKKFEERFGSLGKFLQMQVNEQLAKWQDEENEK
jgi:hypothetical protein